MERLVRFTGVVIPLDLANVDTDQIVPKQFLKLVSREGFGRYLFYHHRYREDGTLRHTFVLNRDEYANGKILLARENFGCGSSREHAPWALADYGFRALIAPSFADIFKTNCYRNGLLPIELPVDQVDILFERVHAMPGYAIAVDLGAQTLTGRDGFVCSFEVDAFRKKCLMEGLDDIALALEHETAIQEYERSHRQSWRVPAELKMKPDKVPA